MPFPIGTKHLSLTVSEIFNVESSEMTLDTTSKQRSRLLILVPIDFLHSTSCSHSNFCSRTRMHRLATIYITSQTDDDRRRQTQHCTNSATVIVRSAKKCMVLGVQKLSLERDKIGRRVFATSVSYWWSLGTKHLSLTVSEIFNVECSEMTLDTTSKQRSRSLILVPIDFLHSTSCSHSNFCSRTRMHRLATIYITSQTDDGRRNTVPTARPL